MGRLDVEVRRGSIGCHAWVVGVLWACKYMMFRGCFRNSFFGSFFESFGVSPSGEFLRGLGMKDVCSVSLIWVKICDVTPALALSLISNSGKNMRCNTRLR
jgi:hypothetical protein